MLAYSTFQQKEVPLEGCMKFTFTWGENKREMIELQIALL